MRRIVQPYRIIFVDRARGWSFVFFVSSLVLALMGTMAAERKDDPSAFPLSILSFIGFGAMFLLAFWFLFRKRAFIADFQDRSLTVIQGWLFGKRVARHSLDQVSIKMERKVLSNGTLRSGPYALIAGRIYLRIHNEPDILFLDDLRGAEAETLAQQLSNDLGRPVTQVDREDW